MAKKKEAPKDLFLCAGCRAPRGEGNWNAACSSCGSPLLVLASAGDARVRAVRHISDWLERVNEAKTRSGGDYRRLLALEWQAAYGESLPNVSLDLIFRKLSYRIQVAGYEQEGLAVPEKMRQNQVIAERLAGEGFSYDDVLRAQRAAAQGGHMAETKRAKATEGPRRTIQTLCGELFAAKTGSAEDMIAAVKKEFPDSAFKENHVSFYAAKFRKGELSGQAPGQYTIAWLPARGAAPKAEEAPAAKASAPAKMPKTKAPKAKPAAA